jgi:hypothetical protein
VLLFTFSRSECPCPKAFTGPESFDAGKHWQVCDIQFVILAMQRGFKIRFKSVKQDPRVERPQARGTGDGDAGDWSYVGDIPDSIFSLSRWYSALMQHFGGARSAQDPFFMAKDGVRAYTYRAAMADLEAMLARVGCTVRYGLHSFRVLGYNLSKRANGEGITVAHGLWLSSAHTRYERFGMSEVMAMAANMVRDVDPSAQPARLGERALPAARVPVQRASAQRADEAAEAVESESHGDRDDRATDLLPEGYTQVEHVGPSGRVWYSYGAPDGATLRSRVECWRHADARSHVSTTPAGAASSARPRGSPRRALGARSRARVVPVEAVDEEAAASPAQSEEAARAPAMPLSRRLELEEMSSTQCGNPACLVQSVNGRHAGTCLFPEPAPRRRHVA